MRTIVSLNAGWRFSKSSSSFPLKEANDWIDIDLPYTWNGKDGQDGGNDYYRGTCAFAKEIPASAFIEGKVHYLQFDGVNSSCDVYWNGEHLAHHDGGYSTFRVHLPSIRETNSLVVMVDNSPNDSVYPQTADFTFYGGIYRNVSLLSLSPTHFDVDYYGTPGIKVTPKIVGEDAEIEIQGFAEGVVLFEIFDGERRIDSITLEGKNPIAQLKIPHVHRWHGVEDPYLYRANATLLENNEPVDAVSTRFGVREFSFDPEKGFFLNGVSYPLRGVSRHQDRPELGNALSLEHHQEDLRLILEVGANTIRLAHYQHAKEFYDMCDEAGLILWAEIPYISRHMPKGKDNTVSQMTELIVQNYNHPSIVVWGLSNEITLNGASDPTLIENHRILNDLVHHLDPTRKTVIAVVTMCDPSEEYVSIPDVISYNHYFGWYGGTTEMNGEWFDDFHKRFPRRVVGLSEYGCEALDWHSSNPIQGDYTEEYQSYYHEELIKTIARRPYLWATYVWNMFDFAADARAEGGEAGMNHKGLVTFDRKYKKDSFYAYQAFWSKKPVLHICSKRYVDRVEEKTFVKVYSNLPEVELYVNGALIEKRQKGEFPFFDFEIENKGESQILVKAGELEDSAVIRKVETPNQSYIMKEEGSVINWFEIEAPAGYLSVNDTLGEIFSTFRGKFVIFSFLISLKKILAPKDKQTEKGKKKKAEIMGMPLNRKAIKPIMKMAMGFPMKRIFSMIGKSVPKELILATNAKLIRIKKPKKKAK
ncbi:MAG: glycoside hydrolase family 2 TIM barrel-domain containing protein [Candidatus Enteromonas sp.]|nr:glycoside hydrolase family 2 TIM barrel-domain containing protein [Candidatus Enteromonas sp.]